MGGGGGTTYRKTKYEVDAWLIERSNTLCSDCNRHSATIELLLYSCCCCCLGESVISDVKRYRAKNEVWWSDLAADAEQEEHEEEEGGPERRQRHEAEGARVHDERQARPCNTFTYEAYVPNTAGNKIGGGGYMYLTSVMDYA